MEIAAVGSASVVAQTVAAWYLVPLAAWVAFAGVLNIAIWRLNG